MKLLTKKDFIYLVIAVIGVLMTCALLLEKGGAVTSIISSLGAGVFSSIIVAFVFELQGRRERLKNKLEMIVIVFGIAMAIGAIYLFYLVWNYKFIGVLKCTSQGEQSWYQLQGSTLSPVVSLYSQH